MNIYVETNFVLEITFEQEQLASCEKILELCEAGKSNLIIPAYSLAEPHEKLHRQVTRRLDLQQSLERELRQLSRTASYTEQVGDIDKIARLLLQTREEERSRFDRCRLRIFEIAEVIPLTAKVLKESALCESQYDLSPQDALVYASVVEHLGNSQPQQSCFLNRNSRDFDSPSIVNALKNLNCKMISRFDSGYAFLQSQ